MYPYGTPRVSFNSLDVSSFAAILLVDDSRVWMAPLRAWVFSPMILLYALLIGITEIDSKIV